MKQQLVLPACLLLLWTLTGLSTSIEITAKTVSDGVVFACKDGSNPEQPLKNDVSKLTYDDSQSGEYSCGNEGPKIYVKFRSCDNCIELDQSSIVGLAIGNLVATVVIGVAVYLIASQTRPSPTPSNKKSSDRQHLVPNEMSSGGSNDHYQPLKNTRKDTYDVLKNRR
ncbi:uncharacterized protein V6R79_015831 [Siganus canaliculatus]